eukprot:51046-Eustigmatos_ZCMA.PRE.1
MHVRQITLAACSTAAATDERHCNLFSVGIAEQLFPSQPLRDHHLLPLEHRHVVHAQASQPPAEDIADVVRARVVAAS